MMSLAETAIAIGARILPPLDTASGRALSGRSFASVSTDSRSFERNAMFVALRGERFDGHAFLAAVSERGAAAAMIDERAANELAAGAATVSQLPMLVVDDTRRGLGRLAAHWRSRFAIPLVAVAGSNGKTTVKEMVAAILRAHYGSEATLATAGNLNNDIGLPLTLLRLASRHASAVVEVGMNHPGETRELAAIARPTVALVNNAQREHQEFMASVEDVAREHGALFEALPADGIAVINADDVFADYWRKVALSDARRSVRDFGIAGGLATKAAVRAKCELKTFGSDIELVTPEGRVEFSLQAAGQHNARNAVAAAAAATAAGASLDAVAQGLSAFAPVKGRLQQKAGLGGAVVIDDTYNANPDSVLAAIDALAQAAPGGRRVLALGDMGEVGERGPAFHAEIGRYARAHGVAQLLAAGELSRHVVAAFGSGARHFDSVEALALAARACDVAGTTVLVKGSRFMRMERVVRALTGEDA